MSDPYKAMLDWCERTFTLSKQGKELIMNNGGNFKNPKWLEDEEVYAIVAKILPHLEGLSYSQAERVLNYTKGQVGNVPLDARAAQQACEELQRASSGQE